MHDTPLSNETILAYAAGALNDAEARDVARVVAQHSSLQTTVALYKTVAELRRTDDSVAAPDSLRTKARSIMASHATSADRTPGWFASVQQFVAALVFDSRVQTSGYRSGAVASRVQLAFEHDDVSVDIVCERDDTGSWLMTGQRSDGGGRVVAAEAGTTAMRQATVADDRGMFRMNLPAGRYDILLETDRGVLRLEGIALSPDA